MSLFATVRQRQTPWARRALGIFVAVWLNLALQPCAMAFGGEEEPHCPNCPPSHTEQHRGHDMDSTMDMSNHDMSDRAMPCADGSSDCSILDDFNYDGRNAQTKFSADDLPFDLLATADVALAVKPTRLFYVRPLQSHPPGPPRPLNKLFCVYTI